jgi:endonuclease/exonuclease/phosphatase (EEP) superfamily protein YafD
MRFSLDELTSSVLVLLASVLVAFAPDAYLPMLLRAFLMPILGCASVVTVMAAWRRRWWLAGAAGLGGMMMLAQVVTPTSIEESPVTIGHEGAALRVFHMNVLQPNTSYAQAIAQALQSEADIISVQEVDPRWAAELRMVLGSRYPFFHLEPRQNCYGIALFSKLPFERVATLESAGAPFIEAWLKVGGDRIRLIAVHATSPISYDHFRRRNEQLQALGGMLACDDTSTIVIGDLNTVPWDQAFRRFCTRAGLRSSAPSTYRTWPSIGPFAAIPLDHILVTGDLATSDFTTIDIPGSDHRGLYAALHHR